MGSVVQKYLSSIKKLSADFPNHNLELQLEISDPATRPPVVPMRRIFRRYKQPKMRRSGDETNTVIYENQKPIAKTITEQATAVHSSATTYTIPALAPNTTPVSTLGPQEKPIYREDLQRALEEFEKKISNIQITTGYKGYHSIQTVTFPTYTTLHSPTYMINRNIENIVELLKRGVHVETHVDKPSDENLDWLQIKIPKNI